VLKEFFLAFLMMTSDCQSTTAVMNEMKASILTSGKPVLILKLCFHWAETALTVSLAVKQLVCRASSVMQFVVQYTVEYRASAHHRVSTHLLFSH